MTVLYATEKVKLLEVKSYIDDNLSKDLSNLTLALQFGYSTTTLARHFKLLFNSPLGKYVVNQRMQKAHSLIAELAAPVSSIGSMVGYKNRSSFTRAFEKHFGYSPSELIEKKLREIAI